MPCNVTKSNIPPWVFFTFLKLYKWYQIALRITYLSHRNISSRNYLLYKVESPYITQKYNIESLFITHEYKVEALFFYTGTKGRGISYYTGI